MKPFKKIKYIVWSLVVSLAFAPSSLFAQSSNNTFNLVPPKVVPPSPEVASLFKFSELPVTTYTGLPDIAVPVYEIKLKSQTIPVSLQYHSGGVKVDEVASNVGMGWNLSAGGSINAMVRGKEDWLNGYASDAQPITQELISSDGQYLQGVPNGGPSYVWYKEVVSGMHDTEPDMFNFSGPGINGKFFFDQQTNIHIVPVQPLRVSYVTINGIRGFRVINEKGVIYDFNETEQSYSSTGSTNYNWYLTRIITPETDTVTFTYQRLTYKYKSFFGATRAKYISGFHDVDLMAQVGTTVVRDNDFDTVTVSGSRLKTISCNNGTKIDLTYAASQRLDLPGTNALTAISIYYGNSLIKKVNLLQEYIGNTAFPDQNRLRLMQVSEEGADGTVAAPYKFFYDNSRALPVRLHNGQDHWGYYNGKGGSHRYPRNIEYWNNDPNSVDRNPDTSYSKAGLMTSMQYPTGGTTAFDYEPNDIWVENEQTITTTTESVGCYGTPFTTTERIFTIPVKAKNKRIAYNTYAQYIDPGPPFEDPPIDDNPTCNIYVKFPDGHLEYLSGINVDPDGDAVSWPAGDYRVTVETYGDNSRSYFSIAYEITDTTYYTGSKIVGGWRIKRITYKDPFHPARNKITKFSYAANDSLPGRSSGVMPATKPVYEYFRSPAMYKVYTDPGGPGGGEIMYAEYKTCFVIVQSANSILPLWGDHGHIFYPRVTVYDGENGENGKTVYYYSYDPPRVGYFGYPFTPGTNIDWLNGLLLKKEEFRKDPIGTYTLLRSTENKYSVAPDSVYWRHYYSTPEPADAMRGIGLAVAPIVGEMTLNFSFYPAVFDAINYSYASKWLRLDTTIVTQYTGAPGGAIQTATAYSYENGLSLQATEIKIENSKKEQSKIVNTYPNDYSTAPVYKKMMERNIVGPVIEQKKYNGDKLLERLRTNYGLTAADLALPSSVERALLGNNPDTEMVYSRYDNKGNLLEYKAKDGITHAFIWAYNRNYPVAAIQGSNYDRAISFITPSLLETTDDQKIRAELAKIRTGLAGEGALVTSYTYTPLIGMTSSTDPSGKTTLYEYDGLGRLKRIKDQNGMILKQYDYQYQKPITQ
jgi:YD repeat-containing protein